MTTSTITITIQTITKRQPYRFGSRCGKFDLGIDTPRGGRIYANHISVRCEPTSQYWKGFIKLQYINPQKQFNSLDMAGNNVNAAVFMAYNLNVIEDQEMALLENVNRPKRNLTIPY